MKEKFRGKRVLVVGLGLHGGAVSAIKWLLKQGAHIRVTDIKSQAELDPSIRALQKYKISFHLGGHRQADFAWAQIIYQNQGVPFNLPHLQQARRKNIPIVNEVTLFFEGCPARIIGVTGTRGKSTTTALLGAMLKAQHDRTFVTGNIRQTPMLELLGRLTAQDTVVVELSSFHLEFFPLVKRGPVVSVITNLKVDHLNRYGTMANYAKAKYQIVRWQTSNDIAILNFDSRLVKQAKQHTQAEVRWFSQRSKPTGNSIFIQGQSVVERSARRVKKITSLNLWPLPGKHQRENLLAAISAARAVDVSPANIQRALKSFTGLPHRQALVRRWRGHDFVNDTTATTPDGTLAALSVYPDAVFIVGGTDKQLQYTQLAKEMKKHNSPLVFLAGTGTSKLLKALKREKWHGHHAVGITMEAAVRHAAALAKPGQAIVLSPGAASFGDYQHEFDRGEQFVRQVNKL